MSSVEELQQLAHLLRVGASAAREIVLSRSPDIMQICELATQAEQIADGLDAISTRLMAAYGSRPGGSGSASRA